LPGLAALEGMTMAFFGFASSTREEAIEEIEELTAAARLGEPVEHDWRGDDRARALRDLIEAQAAFDAKWEPYGWARNPASPRRRDTNMSKFAAIGSDGTRPVVWGLGATENEAIADARGELAKCEPHERDEDLRVVPVSDDRAARIDAGDVDASDL
jgi:hypothetical protein